MRLRRVDAFLLGILLPAWAAWLVFVVAQLAAGRPPVWPMPLHLERGPDPGSPPVVGWIHPAFEGGRVLRPGDTLLRAGSHDLAGVTLPGLTARVTDAARTELPVPVAIRRGGDVMTVGLDIRRPHPLGIAPVWSVLSTIACVLIPTLLLLRAPEAPAARPLFISLVTAQFYFGTTFPGPPIATYAVLLIRPLANIVACVCFLQGLLLLVPETAPKTRFGLWWPLLFVPHTLLVFSSELAEMPLRADIGWRWLEPFGWGAFGVAMLAVITRNVRRASPVGRRRIKWVAFGCYLVYAPRVLQSVVGFFGYGLSLGALPIALTGVAIPASLAIAAGRYNLFDIDRLISVTASYTVLTVLALGIVLGAFPRVASAASTTLGLDPATGQLALGVVLAGVLVPAGRVLRSQVERVFFTERYALERGVADLLGELSACPGPDGLYGRTGERLDALVRPETCVVYTRSGDAFVPAFLRGRVAPASFDVHGPLIAALERCSALLVTRPPVSALEPFDRAALETLGAAVVLPIHRRDPLVAFVCLGAKRSGDVYTTTDLTLLEAVARKVSDELVRFDLSDIVERGRVMEEALRRYVPAAVASELDQGRPVESIECDVSVLFVDIRGYTTFAAAHEASEVFAAVSRYTETVSAIARARGGTIAEFSGDGMMVVFGAPRPLADKERAAVESGREIVDAVAALDGPRLAVGVGIATGPAFVGDVRSAERRIWTALGDTVNLAARLQQLTRSLDAAIVIDAPTRQRARYVAADFQARMATPIRGRPEPADVWMLPS